MKQLTGTSAVITLALTLSACGSSTGPVQAPATIEVSGSTVTASAVVGSTTAATLQFRNGGGTDLGYTASASYPGGQASGWLNFGGADAGGMVKAGESKSVMVNIICQPFMGAYAATVTLLSKDGKLSKAVPVTLNCTAEANTPEHAPVLNLQAAETSVGSGIARVTGAASDNVQVQRVTYRLGGGSETNVAGLTAAKSVALDFTVPGLKAGDNEIVVTAYDTSNNVTSRTMAVTYNAPAASPADQTAPLLTVPGDQLTNARSLTLGGSATDAGGSGLKGVTYTVSRDGTSSAPLKAALDGSAYSLELTDLTDGVYTVGITAEDHAGNRSTLRTVRVTVDRTAPTVTATPDRQPAWNGWYGNDVTVSFACEDALSGVAVCPAPQVLTASGPASVTVQDRAGNTGGASLNVRIDRSAPMFGEDLTGALVPDGEGGYDARVTGTLTDETSVESVTASVNGSAATPVSITPGANVALDLTVLTLQDGPNSIVLTATDVFGRTSQQTVSVVAPDESAPTLVDVSYALVNPGTTGTTLRLFGRATDLIGVTRVTYSLNSSAETDLPLSGSATDVTFDRTVGGLVSGRNSFTIQAYDAAGNVEAQTQTFDVSATDYMAPSISNLMAVYKGKSRNVGVTATLGDQAPIGATAGIARVQIQYTLNGSTTVKTVTLSGAPVSSDLSYKLTEVPVGTLVTVVVTDTSGNVNRAVTKVVKRGG